MPQTLSWTGRRLHPLLVALAGVTATLCCIYVMNHRFFFMDDRQVQYFPYGLIIKQALLDGHLPFVTTRTFAGSALWLDWQYGLFNPLSLLMTLTIMPQHLELSGLLFALLMSGLLTAGLYRLGRAYGLLPDFSALLAYLMGTNTYLLYFDSNSWNPALSSLGLFAFAWTSLKCLPQREENIPLQVLIAGVLMYLTVSAGWPHTDVALAIVGMSLFARELWRGNRKGALRLAFAASLGVALCLPVIVPVAASLPWTSRVDSVETNGFVGSIPDILAGASNPAWPTIVSNWNRTVSVTTMPIYFLAWFCLPALFLVSWSKFTPRRFGELLAMAAPLFLLMVGSLHVHLLRSPTRWLPHLDIILLIILLTMIQHHLVSFSSRLKYVLGAMVMMALFTLGNPAQPVPQALMLLPLPFVFALFLPSATQAGAGKFLAGYFGLGGAAIALAIAALFPTNTLQYDWGKKDQTFNILPSAECCVNYSLYIHGPPGPHGLLREDEFLYQAMGAYFNVDTIGGYSSLGHRSWARISGNAQNFVSARLQALMRLEPETRARYLDLLKVRTVVVEKDAEAPIAPKLSALGWTRRLRALTVLFEAPNKPALPGTVSWHSPSLEVKNGTMAVNGEYLDIHNGATTGTIVFARSYFPGFYANLDGAPLAVRALDDLFVALDVPPDAAGRLQLGFLPPYFEPCLALAILALLAAGAAALLWGGRESSRAPLRD